MSTRIFCDFCGKAVSFVLISVTYPNELYGVSPDPNTPPTKQCDCCSWSCCRNFVSTKSTKT